MLSFVTRSAPSSKDRSRAQAEDDQVESTNNSNGVNNKHYSVRDRGKALNLAPVRECMVPDLRPTDKIDIVQLNKYLNLTTPPLQNSFIQFEVEDGLAKKVGNRVANTGDNNLFPACSPRRGARPLRLGSAEFVKPGTADPDAKWNQDKPSVQRSATFSPSPSQGNLIVGSTVTSHQQKPRIKSASKHGKMSPYVQFQKELLQQKYNLTRPQTPPQQVSGQRCMPCDRMTELSSAQKERAGKFIFTHGGNEESSPTPTVATANVLDLKDTFPVQNRERKYSLDINHLGIRGTTFKQSEELVLYKNRRATSVKS